MSDQVLAIICGVMGATLFAWCLRSGEATINVNFRDFPRATHPKTYWTLMGCYGAMAIGGFAFAAAAWISNH